MTSVRSWAFPLLLGVVLHLVIALVPLKFNRKTSAEPAPMRVAMVKLEPPPAVEPPPLIEPPPVVEPPPAVEPPPEPVAKPRPKPRPKKPSPAPVANLPDDKPLAASTEVAVAVPEAPSIDDAPLEEQPVDEQPPVEQAVAAVEALTRPVRVPVSAPAPRVDLGAYGAGVARVVNSHKRYPRMARRMKLQGVALVRVRIRPDGTLAGPPRIVQSSRHDILDREVVRMVEVSAPFTPLPPGFAGPHAEIDIPVEFTLSRS